MPSSPVLSQLPAFPPAATGRAFYPGIVTARFYETWDFYTTHLGFRTMLESDYYVQLVHASGAQLGILRQELDGSPAELVSPTDGRGFWLGIDVADADAECARLRAAGVEIVHPPEDKPWGERHCVVRDPNGVLILIGHTCSA
ncbi:MAG TPA: VOC family protein [Opitutaceae bacterium]